MNNELADCDYEIKTATTEDIPGIFEFTNKYFFTGEPLNEKLNTLGRNTSHTYTLEMCYTPGIEKGLCYMIITKSGEIIAYIENAEIKPQSTSISEDDESDSNSNFDIKQVSNLLNHIETQIGLLAKLENSNDKELAVKYIAVHEAWRNKGLGRKLLEKTCELANQKGFKQIRSTCTSAYSAKMFANCEFECVYALKYEDWKNEGKMDFLPHPPHFYAKGMVFRF